MKMRVKRWSKLGDKEKWVSLGKCEVELNVQENSAKIWYPCGDDFGIHEVNMFNCVIDKVGINITGTIRVSDRSHELFKICCEV